LDSNWADVGRRAVAELDKEGCLRPGDKPRLEKVGGETRERLEQYANIEAHGNRDPRLADRHARRIRKAVVLCAAKRSERHAEGLGDALRNYARADLECEGIEPFDKRMDALFQSAKSKHGGFGRIAYDIVKEWSSVPSDAND
jgi:hypothetical protein